MIIVEGPDGAGKSTLIKELRAEFRLPIADRVVSKKTEAMTDLVDWTEKNLSKGFQLEIFDRHRLISEPIYGPILRDKAQPGFDDIEWLHKMMFQMYHIVKPVIIYCIPDYGTVWENVRDDSDNEVVRDRIYSIWSLYLTKAVTDIATYDRAVLFDYTKPFTKTRAFLAVAEAMKGTFHDTHRRAVITE